MPAALRSPRLALKPLSLPLFKRKRSHSWDKCLARLHLREYISNNSSYLSIYCLGCSLPSLLRHHFVTPPVKSAMSATIYKGRTGILRGSVPSIHKSWPVIYELASLAKKTHPPRISSGIATLPFMISSFQLSRRCGYYKASV